MNDKRAKTIRRVAKAHGADWRERRYQLLTNRITGAKQIRLNPSCGRAIYQGAKRDVQTIWAERGW